jgi:hypothetical protein
MSPSPVKKRKKGLVASLVEYIVVAPTLFLLHQPRLSPSPLRFTIQKITVLGAPGLHAGVYLCVTPVGVPGQGEELLLLSPLLNSEPLKVLQAGGYDEKELEQEQV